MIFFISFEVQFIGIPSLVASRMFSCIFPDGFGSNGDLAPLRYPPTLSFFYVMLRAAAVTEKLWQSRRHER